ncbi:unnamed protein product [Nezara viridula]|uniref:Uncharacterized protein n=1 Tax=Nezara viridula TaxID=85310 RepID=A0A9P0HPW2_NEZVI|nr:unnamed protein product [Nezara viridula]
MSGDWKARSSVATGLHGLEGSLSSLKCGQVDSITTRGFNLPPQIQRSLRPLNETDAPEVNNKQKGGGDAPSQSGFLPASVNPNGSCNLY